MASNNTANATLHDASFMHSRLIQHGRSASVNRSRTRMRSSQLVAIPELYMTEKDTHRSLNSGHAACHGLSELQVDLHDLRQRKVENVAVIFRFCVAMCHGMLAVTRQARQEEVTLSHTQTEGGFQNLGPVMLSLFTQVGAMHDGIELTQACCGFALPPFV